MIAGCTHCGHTDYETRRSAAAPATDCTPCPECGGTRRWVEFVTALELERRVAPAAASDPPIVATEDGSSWVARMARRVVRR